MKNLLSALGLMLFSWGAHATVIDFSDVPSVNSGCLHVSDTTLVSKGYEFSGNPDEPHLFVCRPTWMANNIGLALINGNGLGLLHMSAVDGKPFVLSSFSAGTRTELIEYYLSTGVDVVGQVHGGGTVSAHFDFDGTRWGTFTLGSGWDKLDSVTWTGSGTPSDRNLFEFALNNIDVAAVDPADVPEPGSAALLGLGLLGIAALRRARRT